MRLRLLTLASAVLLSSCIKRVAPDPGGDRNAYSGAHLRFGQPEQLPPGSEAQWDFGDGTPQQTGTVVTHAFPRPGVYTVVETIADKDGQSRNARTHVSVLRRDVAMAVPAQIRAVLLAQRPWAKVDLHRQTAEKLSLGSLFDKIAKDIGAAAGFDPLDPKAADAAGFDPDEGVALYTVPEDPEALVFVVGTSDDAKSLAAAKRVLAQGMGHGAFELKEATIGSAPAFTGQNAAGEKVGILQSLGYLYLRTPGQSDPLKALQSAAALPPDKGLFADPGYQTALRHIGPGDATFYSRAADSDARLGGALATSAFSVLEKPELLQLRMYAMPRTLTGDKLAAAFTPEKAPPDLASQLPSGAAAYLRISAAPQALWAELTRAAGTDTSRMRDRLLETTGLDLEKELIPSFTGNVGVAVYLDATSLVSALLGEQVGSFDRSQFLVAAQLGKPDTIRAALEKAMKTRPPTDRAEFAGASWFRLSDGAQAALKGDVLLLSIGGAPPAAVEAPAKGKKPPPKPKAPTLEDLGMLGRALAPAGAPTLSQSFKRIGVAGFEQSGQENVWVDVAGIVKSIERAGNDQGGVASAGAHLFADRAAGLRDALFEARPNKDGIDADLWLRFAVKKSK
ncbi:MAG TPA: PKD domain-containing protein [Myxococcales bacterium]|nr:PKD domain-containing protein [Myxococcales bacterium]